MIKDPSSLYIYISTIRGDNGDNRGKRRRKRRASRILDLLREAVFYERIFGKPASLSASHEFLIPDAIPLFTRKGLCPRLSTALLLTRSIGNFQTVIAYLKGADKYFRERNRWNFLRPGERILGAEILFFLSPFLLPRRNDSIGFSVMIGESQKTFQSRERSAQRKLLCRYRCFSLLFALIRSAVKI